MLLNLFQGAIGCWENDFAVFTDRLVSEPLNKRMRSGIASPAWRNAGDLANVTMVLGVSYRNRKLWAVKQKLPEQARVTGAKPKFHPVKRKSGDFQHSSVSSVYPIVGLERRRLRRFVRAVGITSERWTFRRSWLRPPAWLNNRGFNCRGPYRNGRTFAGEFEGPMIAAISRDELLNAVDEIFSSMASMQLVPSDSLLQPDKRKGGITSTVQIVGNWQGAVRLDIDLKLARVACASLLGVAPDDLSQDDVRDAAGELANITGGSVKALLAPTCSLSLPSVVIGQDYEFSFLQGKVIQEAAFSHESGILLVSIIEKQEP
jgi:chemotaxis protein CheX